MERSVMNTDKEELVILVNKAKFGEDIVNTRVDLKGGNYESYGITTSDKAGNKNSRERKYCGEGRRKEERPSTKSA